MDLSGLKWPAIIGAIVLVGWLASSPGVNYMEKKFTAYAPGTNAQLDTANEAGLSRLAWYCLWLFKYEKARQIYETVLTRYPEGSNCWNNQYQLALCLDRLEDYKSEVDILRGIIGNEASKKDNRVPNDDALRLKIDRLVEIHEIEKR